MTDTDQGTLIEIDGKSALRFERRYSHPMERVWRAISDPTEMAAWFPSNVIGERAVGAELVFDDDAQRAAAQAAGEVTRADGPLFHGRVVAYDPPKVFSFTWGGELLRFELIDDRPGTLLVFTQVLSHQSVAARNGSGWHMCLAGLDALLGVAPAPSHDGWKDVYEDYLDRIGPELGVPTGDGGLTWERATHVPLERVREVTAEPSATAGAWGASDHADEPVRWDIEPAEFGTVYRVTHDAIDADPELAATWHALLVQLDMYLAAGELVPVDPKPWVDAYADLLGGR